MIKPTSKTWVGDIMPLGKAMELYPPGQGVIDPSGNTIFLFGPTTEGGPISVLRPHWTGRWRRGRQGPGPRGWSIFCRLDIEEWSPYVLVRPSGGFYRSSTQVRGHGNEYIRPIWVCPGVDLPGELGERQAVDEG